MPHEPSSEHDTDVLARGSLDAHDAHVLACLARAAAIHDPVPGGLVDRVRFAVALDEVYAEVAEIQRDTRTSVGTGVRSQDAPSGASTLTFSADDASMTITVSTVDRRHVRIDGWVTTVAGAVVALRIPGETRREPAHDGRFWFDGVPRGQMQLLVEDADGHVRMLTPAVEI